MKKYIAFDIGGTKVKYGILDEMGIIMDKGEIPTRVETLDMFLGDLEDIVKNYKENHQVEGIAISMPGFINSITGIPEVCVALRCTEGVSIKNELQNRVGLNVTIENDANCVALAEKFNGNATECNDFACVTLGTGVGGGIFVNGKMLNGSKFKGGEFSYLLVNGITPENKGFEISNENASTKGLINMYKLYKGLDESTKVEGHIVFEEAKNDSMIQDIINNWYKNIAYLIYDISAIINPEKILIGGGISSRPEILDEIRKELAKIEWWKDIEVKLEICKHKNDAGMIGAVYNYKVSNKSQLA